MGNIDERPTCPECGEWADAGEHRPDCLWGRMPPTQRIAEMEKHPNDAALLLVNLPWLLRVAKAAVAWRDTQELPGEVGYRAAVLTQRALTRAVDGQP